jgi:hypothetical protein
MDWGDGTVSPATITQPGGAGTPYVVTGSHTCPTVGTYTTHLTVTDTAISSDNGMSSSTATVTIHPVTLSPVTIAAQLVGTPYSGPVATFTSGDPTTTLASFSAPIDWGAQSGGVEQASSGIISQPGGAGTPFTVSGSNDYAATGNFTITAAAAVAGVTSTLTEPIEVDAAQVVVPCTNSCSGGVTTPIETSAITTNSTTGSVFVALADGTLNCGGNYQYAPQITTVITSGVPSAATVKVRVTFLRRNLQGPAGAPLAVCFESNHPFVQLDGTTTSPVQVAGQTQYIGLLPRCMPTKPRSSDRGPGSCRSRCRGGRPSRRTSGSQRVTPGCTDPHRRGAGRSRPGGPRRGSATARR